MSNIHRDLADVLKATWAEGFKAGTKALLDSLEACIEHTRTKGSAEALETLLALQTALKLQANNLSTLLEEADPVDHEPLDTPKIIV